MPCEELSTHGVEDGASAAEIAAQAWARITVPYIAQRPVMRRSPDGGRTFPRQSDSGYRYEVAIQTRLPNRPTTVPTGDRDSGTTRIMVLDLDTSRVPLEGAADRPGYVAAVASRVAALIEECGGQVLVDVSPNGGRHVTVLWSAPRPYVEVRQLTKALALRFAPVVDTSPMEHTDGQIRGPGSPHKSLGGRLTGYMTLTCSVAEAEAICTRPCGAQVWEALHVEMAAELAELAGGRPYEARHVDAPAAPLDAVGEPFWPRRGGRRPLGAAYAEIACTGRFAGLYPSSSEARQAVLTSAAARGWRLDQIRKQLAPRGAWAAISGWWRDDKLLAAEWDKAITFTTPAPAASPARTTTPPKVGNPVHSCNTSVPNLTPPGASPDHSSHLGSTRGPEQTVGGKSATAQAPYIVKSGDLWGLEVQSCNGWQAAEYRRVRIWQNALLIVERRQELDWGRRALSYRSILRALGAAAQMCGSTTIEFGTRQLAYAAAVDHTTVCRALRVLREGPYALIDKIDDAQGVRADTYQLVVPDAVAAEAAWRSFRAGRIEAIHPAFRVLGHPAAMVYEALSGTSLPVHELSAGALLPRSTTYKALHILASHGLAEPAEDGRWRRGATDLNTAAAANGADALAAAQLAGHREDRREWHLFLGILLDQPTATKQRPEPVAASDATRSQRRETRNSRPYDPRRRAPSWLVPPPRTRPITETDLFRPPDFDPADLVGGLPTWRDPPELGGLAGVAPDIAAAMREENRAVLADQRTPAEDAEYETVLVELRLDREAEQTTRTRAGPAPPRVP